MYVWRVKWYKIIIKCLRTNKPLFRTWNWSRFFFLFFLKLFLFIFYLIINCLIKSYLNSNVYRHITHECYIILHNTSMHFNILYDARMTQRNELRDTFFDKWLFYIWYLLSTSHTNWKETTKYIEIEKFEIWKRN